MPKNRSRASPGESGLKSVAGVKLITAGDGLIRASASPYTLEVSVLAEDLFRLRLGKGRSLSDAPSWAIIRDRVPLRSAQISRTARTVEIGTGRGQFSLHLGDGSWVLRDGAGLELFRCAPATMG